MNKKHREPTNQDILDAMSSYATNVEGRFSSIESDLGELKKGMSQVVTKNYLDEKLADLRGDLVVLVRK